MNNITARADVSWKSFLAGSLASLMLHGAVLLLVSISLRGCQKASSVEVGGEPFRDIGLVVVDGIDGGLADTGSAAGSGDATTTNPGTEHSSQDRPMDAADVQNSSQRVPTEVPDISTLLNISEQDSPGTKGSSKSELPPLIGLNDPIGGIQRPKTGGGGSLLKSSEAGGAARFGGKGGPGDATFMDIVGVGKSFVYVIDTSSSMHGSRLKLAQSHLKASLRQLQPSQKFAVIFYNDQYRKRLTLRRQAVQEMYFATELNQELAAQEVDRVTSDLGTEHKPAILEALSLKPDVIYFLTDGAEPELSPRDLAQIRDASGNTTIHVIKFGDGTMSSRSTSWLELLARQAGGEYRPIRAGQ